MVVRAITISGEIASGKSAIAWQIAHFLPGWNLHTAGQIYRDYCEAHHIEFDQAYENFPDEVHLMIDGQQSEIIHTQSKIIVDSRLSGWLVKDLPGAYRVFCFARADVRAGRLAERDKVSEEKAWREIEQRELNDVETFQRLYGVQDYRDPALYDLLLDTSAASIDDLARQVIEAAGIRSQPH